MGVEIVKVTTSSCKSLPKGLLWSLELALQAFRPPVPRWHPTDQRQDGEHTDPASLLPQQHGWCIPRGLPRCPVGLRVPS